MWSPRHVAELIRAGEKSLFQGGAMGVLFVAQSNTSGAYSNALGCKLCFVFLLYEPRNSL